MLLNKAKSNCPQCGKAVLVEINKVNDIYKITTFCGTCKYQQANLAQLNGPVAGCMAPDLFLHLLNEFEHEGKQIVYQRAEMQACNAVKH